MARTVFQKAKDKVQDFVPQKAVVLDEEGNPVDSDRVKKVKGTAQMVAGTALVGVGVPMLILPGPGAVAVVSGAALASKGHRNLTNREALPIEETIDAAAAQMGALAKEQAKEIGTRAVEKAPDVRDAVASGASKAASAGVNLAKKGASALAEKRKKK